jgi:hypothetical protein
VAATLVAESTPITLAQLAYGAFRKAYALPMVLWALYRSWHPEARALKPGQRRQAGLRQTRSAEPTRPGTATTAVQRAVHYSSAWIALLARALDLFAYEGLGAGCCPVHR